MGKTNYIFQKKAVLIDKNIELEKTPNGVDKKGHKICNFKGKEIKNRNHKENRQTNLMKS